MVASKFVCWAALVVVSGFLATSRFFAEDPRGSVLVLIRNVIRGSTEEPSSNEDANTLTAHWERERKM